MDHKLDAMLYSFAALQPRRADAAGVLLRDQLGRVLLVKSPYKRHWDLPGGMVESSESAVQAAFREVTEELGLVLTDLRLLVADCLHATPRRPYGVRWVFDGGVINSGLPLILQPDEIEDARWVHGGDARWMTQAAPMLQARIQIAMYCARTQQEVLMVNGEHRHSYPRSGGQRLQLGLLEEPAYLSRVTTS